MWKHEPVSRDNVRNRIGYLRELFNEINEDNFGGKLHNITLLIKRNRSKDGWYMYRARRDWAPIIHEGKRASITICEDCWPEGTVDGTLIHEMIHQYQCEVMHQIPHHNRLFKSWARKLERKYGVVVR